MNYFDRSVWGDERAFARLAAHDCKLIERERLAENMDLRAAMQIAPMACPKGYLKTQQQRRMDIPLAQEEGAALFTGRHGDGVFFTKTGFSATDYVCRRGLGRELLRVVHSTAVGRGKAAWKVLPAALREGTRARREPYSLDDESEIIGKRRFVARGVAEEFRLKGERYLRLPWLHPGQSMPPGKVRHMRMMFVPTCMTSPLEQHEDPDWVSPLASQPVMELFLRIPTYVLTAQGRNRAVARRAFAGDVPPPILSRRSKAAGNHMTLTVFRRNEAFYRETLLDGVLVGEGLLDRREVERFFASGADPGMHGLGELLQSHFNLEIWLRSWVRPARAALIA